MPPFFYHIVAVLSIYANGIGESLEAVSASIDALTCTRCVRTAVSFRLRKASSSFHAMAGRKRENDVLTCKK
jgi:hypothetical protein